MSEPRDGELARAEARAASREGPETVRLRREFTRVDAAPLAGRADIAGG
jgi:hypothetical protein